MYELEALFDNRALRPCRGTTHYPSFVIEVTQNDEDPSTFGTKRVLDGYFDIVECDESCTGRR
jgi:hypothetical protein